MPSIHNRKLLQSALKATEKVLIAFGKTHRCCFYSAAAEKIGFASSSQTHYFQHKQDDVILRINIVIPCGSVHRKLGNKWKCEHAVGRVTVSSPLSLAAFGVMWFNTASERPPYSETCVQNMMNCIGAFKWHHFTSKQKRSLVQHFNISSSMRRVQFQLMLSYASINCCNSDSCRMMMDSNGAGGQ